MNSILKRRDNGFSLMTVIFVVLATAIAGTAVISLFSTSSQMLVDEYKAQQAFDLAQTGISYTAQELVEDGDWSDNMGGTVNFGPGFFTTTYVEQTASTVTVRSVGDVDGTTRTVEQKFTRGTPAAFEDAIYTEGDLLATGNTDVVVGGSVTTGGGVDVTGNTSVDMEGPITQDDTDASIPTPDWSYWKSVADHTILGNYTFGEGAYSGVYYVSGMTSIMNLSNFTLNGTIVSRGQVRITNNSDVTITASGTNPAIVSEGLLNISNNTNVTVAGWLFSLDRVQIVSVVSGFACSGGIVADGTITATGNSNFTVEYDVDRVPEAGFIGGEPGSGTGGATIMYGDWNEEF